MELAAFAAECAAAERTLAEVPVGALDGPGLGEWPLRVLLGHLIGVAGRLDVYVRDALAAGLPQVDRYTYYTTPRRPDAPVRSASAAQDAEGIAPTEWPARLRERWQASADRFVALGTDAVVATPHGWMLAGEFLATRVLEVCVHHLDVRAALSLPPAPTSEGSEVTVDLLEGVLGAPRPPSMDTVGFILAACGRAETDDPRLPLLR